MPQCSCIICNTSFYSKRNSQICDNCRIRTCRVCGKEFTIDPSNISKTTCSRECRSKLSSLIQTGQIQSGETRICKYCGKEFTSNHNRRDYCYDDHFATCEVCGKEFKILHMDSIPKTCSRECATKHMATTNLTLRGVQSNFQTDEFKKMSSETCQKRYGVSHWSQAQPIKDKISENVRKARQNSGPEIKSKWEASLVQSKGVPFPRMQDFGKSDEYLKFMENPEEYLTNLNLPTVCELEHRLGVNNTTILKILHEQKLENLVSWKQWTLEEEVISFLKSEKPDIQIQRHNRTLIAPQEIDIYLPEYNLGIECNPTCTHNSSVPDPWGGKKSEYYHQEKSQRAEKTAVTLFHIFGYEWQYKQDIIESMLRSRIHHTNRIFGRECEVVELTSAQAKVFLTKNHRQGYTPAEIKIGLSYKGEIVALMTFSKPRKFLTNDKVDYELVRFCNKLNTTVVGGADKIFKYFLKTYNPDSVISYSDIARTSGNLYEKLGFKLERTTSPNYMWVNYKDNTSLTRYQTQKHRLLELFPDCDINQTEKEIMISNGYVQIFDSGNKVWRYCK